MQLFQGAQCFTVEFGGPLSNPKASGNHGVFRHDYDSVADVIIGRIKVRCLAFRRDHHTVADARVFVDDRAVDDAIPSDPDGWKIG